MPQPRITRILRIGLLAALTTAPAVHAASLEGFTEPYRTIEVATSEVGTIASVAVEPGQLVRQNQLLAALDTAVLEAALDVARHRAASTAAQTAARTEYDLKRQRAEQLRVLRAGGHATPSELARAEADVVLAAARLKLAEEERTLHELDCQRIAAQIAQRQVRSPVAAVVAEVHREVGEAVTMQAARLVTLVQLGRLRVTFAVPPSLAARLRAGQVLPLSLPDFQQQIEGSIERIAPVIDARSGTVDVCVTIENSTGVVRSGARCLCDPASWRPAVDAADQDQPVATRPLPRSGR